MQGCLAGVRVLDLSRVFSGPWAGQLLADLGADVIKVERPRSGDDVRALGYRAKDEQGQETTETSSFLAMNRGKRSVTIDLAKPAGQALVRRLAKRCDVLLENFKAGDLQRYGLDWDTLRAEHPQLIYCSISGFGQSGPYRHLPGYDPIFQAMSGLMSITGHADGDPGGGPQRAGYAVSDLTAGFYATTAILGALYHRDARGGGGQYIDIAMLDAQVAAMSHIALNYLVSGEIPARLGTASPITCPYQAFECADGQIMIAVGNDAQFRALCAVLGRPELGEDPRFATNRQRIAHRLVLVPILAEVLKLRSVQDWNAAFWARSVPSGPIYDMRQVFEDPQVRARGVLTDMPHPTVGKIPVVTNPVRFSETGVTYRRPPPLLGEHTHEVLSELLECSEGELAELAAAGVL